MILHDKQNSKALVGYVLRPNEGALIDFDQSVLSSILTLSLNPGSPRVCLHAFCRARADIYRKIDVNSTIFPKWELSALYRTDYSLLETRRSETYRFSVDESIAAVQSNDSSQLCGEVQW
jgi:hypothetical protein